jgi:endonuclease/exonuclease/phosphatase family metal-dependent hydrolase
LKKKGVLESVVSVPSGPLTVLATHLQSGRSARAAHARTAQIEQLLDWAAAHQGQVLLLGDFNLEEENPRDHAALQLLRRAGYVDAAEHRGQVAPTHAVGTRLDRIYLRGGLVAEHVATIDRSDLSDHSAVVASLRLAEP